MYYVNYRTRKWIPSREDISGEWVDGYWQHKAFAGPSFPTFAEAKAYVDEEMPKVADVNYIEIRDDVHKTDLFCTYPQML